jgi:hypothetical protein
MSRSNSRELTAPGGSPLILKSSRRYLLWRFYTTLAIPLFWTSCLALPFPKGRTAGILVAVGIAAGVPAIFMVMNWLAFPWSYSVFGPYERRRMPVQPPLRVVWSWGTIGNVNATYPLLIWLFFPDGVGIDAKSLGKAYLPADRITLIEKRRLGQYVVHHNCTEIRSPIIMSGSAFSAMLLSLDDNYRQRLTATQPLP